MIAKLGVSSLKLRNREPLSPLGPPPIQDPPTRLGLHPAAKSVGALSLNAARLIRALHPLFPSPRVDEQKRLILFLPARIVNRQSWLSSTLGEKI